MHTKNAVFIHEFSTKKFPTVGRGNTPSPHSVASLPRFDPRLTNASCTTGTGIAKGYKSPCPPPPWLEWKKLKGGSRGLVYATSHNLPPNKGINVQNKCRFHTRIFKKFPYRGRGKHTLPHSVASLPRFDPRLTNASCGTGIAKGYKSPCPPPLDWSERN